MRKRKNERELERQLEENRFELQKWQQDANFWRGAAIAVAVLIITLILYIVSQRH